MRRVIFLCLIFMVSLCHAQFQNLALLPTKSIKITNGLPKTFESICLNQNLKAPKNTIYNNVVYKNDVVFKINKNAYKGGLTAAINDGIIQLEAKNQSEVIIKVHPNYKEAVTVELEIKKPLSISENKIKTNKDNFLFIIEKYPFALQDQETYWMVSALIELGYLSEDVKLNKAVSSFFKDFSLLQLPKNINKEIFSLKKLNCFEEKATIVESYANALENFERKFPENNLIEIALLVRENKNFENILNTTKGAIIVSSDRNGDPSLVFKNPEDFINIYKNLKSKDDNCLPIPTVCVDSNFGASFSVDCKGASIEITTDGDLTITASKDNRSRSLKFNLVALLNNSLKFEGDYEESKATQDYTKILQDLQAGKSTVETYEFENPIDFLHAYKETNNAKFECVVVTTVCFGKENSTSFELDCNGAKVTVSSKGSFSFSATDGLLGESISFD